MKRFCLIVLVVITVLSLPAVGCSRKSKGEKDLSATRTDLSVHDTAKGASDGNTGASSIEQGTSTEGQYKYDMAYEPESDIIPPFSYNTEEYTQIEERGFMKASAHPLSTFSIDVDTASYSHLRKCINYGQLPAADSVRIEEMLNYFDYDYDQPEEAPFSINAELGVCPWN